VLGTEQETIEKTIIGKRVVAVAWVPVPNVDGLFVLGSIKLEGGAKLEFQGCDGDAVFARLTEGDHADG